MALELWCCFDLPTLHSPHSPLEARSEACVAEPVLRAKPIILPEPSLAACGEALLYAVRLSPLPFRVPRWVTTGFGHGAMENTANNQGERWAVDHMDSETLTTHLSHAPQHPAPELTRRLRRGYSPRRVVTVRVGDVRILKEDPLLKCLMRRSRELFKPRRRF